MGLAVQLQKQRYHQNSINDKNQLIPRKTIPKIYCSRHKTRKQLCNITTSMDMQPVEHYQQNKRHKSHATSQNYVQQQLFQQVTLHQQKMVDLKLVNSSQMRKHWL